jgi:hypothetical protein
VPDLRPEHAGQESHLSCQGGDWQVLCSRACRSF